MTIPSLLYLLFSCEKQKYSEFEMLHTENVGVSHVAALDDLDVRAEAPRHGGV
ncbi:MAG: hypothetical protein RLZZ332_553 [Actinomycetota bacterium]